MNNLKMTVAAGTLMVLSALGVAAVASNVGAQTTPGTTAATAVPSTPGTTTDLGMKPGRGGHMGGPGGRGGFEGGPMGGPGFGPGGPGGGLIGTSDGATRAINNATSFITLVKGDLAYATGKMDTVAVEGYLKTADSLLASAQSALTASQFGKAGVTAEAAHDLAQVAHSLMAQALGADKLPSYSQRPMDKRGPEGDLSNVTITQAQASRDLARTYNELVVQATLLKNTGNVVEASNLLTAAQNAYKSAFDSYSAGKYNEAVASSRLAGQLSHVVGHLIQAANAPDNADTPVTVPSPNF